MSSGFITEAEIEEKKRKRQEEWERVRKPEDPVEPPPDPVDNRSLYDRLQEQKLKKQEEFEEAHKLKNLVKRLDDDEVQFLDQVDQLRVEEERRKRFEEAKELNEFRNAVSKLREKEYEKAIYQEISMVEKPNKPALPTENVSIGTTKTPQTKLLSGIIKRKLSTQPAIQEETKKSRMSGSHEESVSDKTEKQILSPRGSDHDVTIASTPYKGSLVCIGVLPGLSSYTNSDEDEDDCEHECDSDSDVECDSHDHCSDVRDLCGRRIEYETKKDDK